MLLREKLIFVKGCNMLESDDCMKGCDYDCCCEEAEQCSYIFSLLPYSYARPIATAIVFRKALTLLTQASTLFTKQVWRYSKNM